MKKHSHDVPSPSPQPRPLKPPSAGGRERRGTPKPPKNAAAPGPVQGRPGEGRRKPSVASAHPVVGGAGQLTQLAFEVQVNGEVQVTLWGEGGCEGQGR